MSVGPLPPPQVLSGYAAIDPGLPERIVQQFECEAEHRRSMDRGGLDLRIKESRVFERQANAGRWAAFFVTLVALGLGTWVTLASHDTVGGIVFGTTIVGLAAVFVVGRRARVEEPHDSSERGRGA